MIQYISGILRAFRSAFGDTGGPASRDAAWAFVEEVMRAHHFTPEAQKWLRANVNLRVDDLSAAEMAKMQTAAAKAKKTLMFNFNNRARPESYAMMEYVNELREQGAGSRELVEPLVAMLAPYAPHIAEELWEVLGHTETVFAARWPAFDEKLASAGDVEIAVQVNGKLRSRLTVPRGMAEKDVLDRALADEAVKKFVDGQKLKKVIYVQDRLLNLVV